MQRAGMHPLVAALLGAIGGIFDKQALQVRMGHAKQDGTKVRIRGKGKTKHHDQGGHLGARRAARKARNVARNRRAHRG